MTKYSEDYDLHRPPPRETLRGTPKISNVAAVREHLLKEIVELESRLEHLGSAGGKPDFSLMQTYREMIKARKDLFHQLNR
jgi:hypothetical protein